MANVEFLVSPSRATTRSEERPNLAKAVPYATLVATLTPASYDGFSDKAIALGSTGLTSSTTTCVFSFSPVMFLLTITASIAAIASSALAPRAFPCQFNSFSIPGIPIGIIWFHFNTIHHIV